MFHQDEEIQGSLGMGRIFLEVVTLFIFALTEWKLLLIQTKISCAEHSNSMAKTLPA